MAESIELKKISAQTLMQGLGRLTIDSWIFLVSVLMAVFGAGIFFSNSKPDALNAPSPVGDARRGSQEPNASLALPNQILQAVPPSSVIAPRVEPNPAPVTEMTGSSSSPSPAPSLISPDARRRFRENQNLTVLPTEFSDRLLPFMPPNTFAFASFHRVDRDLFAPSSIIRIHSEDQPFRFEVHRSQNVFYMIGFVSSATLIQLAMGQRNFEFSASTRPDEGKYLAVIDLRRVSTMVTRWPTGLGPIAVDINYE